MIGRRRRTTSSSTTRPSRRRRTRRSRRSPTTTAPNSRSCATTCRSAAPAIGRVRHLLHRLYPPPVGDRADAEAHVHRRPPGPCPIGSSTSRPPSRAAPSSCHRCTCSRRSAPRRIQRELLRRLEPVPAEQIHLVRHGEVFNPQGVLYGRLPGYGLSDLGREMADAAAADLVSRKRSVSALVSSPLQRTQQSAEPIAAGVRPRADARRPHHRARRTASRACACADATPPCATCATGRSS